MADKRIPITVIIPVYNCKKYLQAAVSSVLEQDYDNLSIVMIDDGSTDGSSELCDLISEKESRVHVMHKANGGVSSARNMGIDYALEHQKGGYVTFLDADDAWAHDFFDEKVRDLLNRGYDMVGFQSCLCNRSLTARAAAPILQEGLRAGGTASVWCSQFPSVFYSADLLKKYEIRFINAKYSEDKIFVMQCLYLSDTIWLENKIFHYYRNNNTSAVHTRQRGIPYYELIINNWLQLDNDMRKYANEIKGTFDQGTVLAQIYTMDMIDEHYRTFSPERELVSFFDKHKDYLTSLEDLSNDSPHKVRYLKWKKHPRSYRLKQKCIGLVMCVAAAVKKIQFVGTLADKHRYRFPI